MKQTPSLKAYGAVAGREMFLRPTVARIDLKNLRDNYRALRKKLPVIAVVKADAYGHGAVEIAKTLENLGVAMFAVALIEEGIELRSAGIKKPILIGGSIYPFENYVKVAEYKLIPTVASLDSAKALSHISSSPTKVHVEVDCGMNRTGVGLQNALAIIIKIATLSNISVDGIYTHFPSADSDRELTLTQMKRFRNLKYALLRAGIKPRFFHASNTAALRFAQTDFNLIRPGLGLYGLKPYPSYRGTKPVMSFATKIVYLRKIKKGETVSYGGCWKARKNSVIATIPAGYADGVRRELSGRGNVLIRGRRFRIAGRVCMDMTMIDVTSLKNPCVGEDAVILGRQGANEISAEEIAGLCGTINYEICCGISKRVPRVYVN